MSRSLDAFLAARRLRADQRTVVRPGGEKLLKRAQGVTPQTTPPAEAAAHTPPGPPIQQE